MKNFIRTIGIILIIALTVNYCFNGGFHRFGSDIYKVKNLIISEIERVFTFGSYLDIDWVEELDDVRFIFKSLIYKSEKLDRASHPIVTYIRGYGDCDDFARLGADLLEGIGYRSYIIFLYYRKEGHAMCVAFKDDKFVIVNNYTIHEYDTKSLDLETVLGLVIANYGGSKYRYYDIRDSKLNLISFSENPRR